MSAQPESTERCEVCGEPLGQPGHRKGGLSYDCMKRGYERALREAQQAGDALVRTDDRRLAAESQISKLRRALAEAEKELEERRAEAARVMLFQNQKVTEHEHAARAAEERAAQAERERDVAGERARGMARLTSELAEALERARQEFDSVESYVSSLRSIADAVLVERPAPWESTTHTPETPKDG